MDGKNTVLVVASRGAAWSALVESLTDSYGYLTRYACSFDEAISVIDYTNKNYRKSKFYEEPVRRWAPFVGTNYEVGIGTVHAYDARTGKQLTCMYFLVHRKWCDLPELSVPVEPEWWCRLWRI